MSEQTNIIPQPHVEYLRKLKAEGFEPKVIYDIGACVLHWTNEARRLWPDAQFVLFEANSDVGFLFAESGYPHFIGLLGNKNGQVRRYYYNDECPGGNSYYKEIGCQGGAFYPPDRYRLCSTTTLTTAVKHGGFPLPDLVKMDVQGAERDIVLGGLSVLKHAQHMILELQCVEYNSGAPRREEVIQTLAELDWVCVAPLFCDNGADGDYDFVRIVTK